jgi:hypothetical protein
MIIKQPFELPYRAALRRLAEEVVQFTGAHGSINAGSLSFEPTTMPALPFSNSTGLAPNLMDRTTWPEASVFHQGRTA